MEDGAQAQVPGARAQGPGPGSRARPLGPGPGPLWPCMGHVRIYFLVFVDFRTIFVRVHVQVDDVQVGG